MQVILEQIAVLNRRQFGKSSEKLGTDGQIAFMEVDGKIVFFNEAEAVAALSKSELPEDEAAEETTVPKQRPKKSKGKRLADLDGLPVIPYQHMMTKEELEAEFGKDGWIQLEDEVYRRYHFEPAKLSVEEHHVGVYKSKKDNHFKKAHHPQYLLRNSLVSPSLLAAVMNAKYVNAVPLYRLEQEFLRYGQNIDRTQMAHWIILCAERYLYIFYAFLHTLLLQYHVLQADETPVRVRKEDRTDGDRHYMWVYRTGKMYKERQIVLYDYQATRNASHPREFLKGFTGICVTDGYEVYHKLEREENLRIAGCWAHYPRSMIIRVDNRNAA